MVKRETLHRDGTVSFFDRFFFVRVELNAYCLTLALREGRLSPAFAARIRAARNR